MFCIRGHDHEYKLVYASGYEWSDFPCYVGCKYQYAAFTVAELGQMLGAGITVHKPEPGRNEAFDRADDLIHLLEIGELLIDSVNDNLSA